MGNVTFDPKRNRVLLPQSVKNFNPQYQKGLKMLDKNSRLYSAETTHRYKSTNRRLS